MSESIDAKFGRHEYTIGSSPIIHSKPCGPGNICNLTVVPLKVFDYHDAFGNKTHHYTGVLRLPLRLDDTTFEAYRQVMKAYNAQPAVGGTTGWATDKNAFIQLVKHRALNDRGTQEDERSIDFRSVQLFTKKTFGDEDALLEEYEEHLKKEDTYAAYHAAAKTLLPKTTDNSWAYRLSAALGGIVGGVQGYGEIGEFLGGMCLGVVGGVMLGGLADGVLDVLDGKRRTKEFYRQVCTDARLQLQAIDAALKEVEPEVAKAAVLLADAKRTDDDTRRLLKELAFQQLGIQEYAAKKGHLESIVRTSKSTIDGSAKALAELVQRRTTLYHLAGRFIDKETFRPGLIVRYHAKTFEEVMEGVKQFMPMEKLVVAVPAQTPTEQHSTEPLPYPPDGAPVELEDFQTFLETKQEKPKAVSTITATFNDYTLLEHLGTGGIGQVYRAKANDGAVVALKVPADKESERHFRKTPDTIKALLSLQHPNIVRLYQMNVDGAPFEAREYVEGKCLDAIVKESLAKPLKVEHQLNILRQVAAALAYAHKQDVVHGDVKLQNILVDKNGIAKLTDFDQSKVYDPQEIVRSIAATGIIGSFDYIAPEQRRGEPTTPLSDQYGFGAVAFHLLTGKPKSETIKPIQKENPNVPDAIVTLIEKCLETNPNDRYKSMDEVLAAVAQALPQRAVTSTAQHPQQRMIAPEAYERARDLMGGNAALVEKVVQKGMGTAEQQKEPVNDETRMQSRQGNILLE